MIVPVERGQYLELCSLRLGLHDEPSDFVPKVIIGSIALPCGSGDSLPGQMC